ncbi:hypothetical protein, partial [Rhizobium leucaenae]|uniref:hypothetical protein n=1 Tax=Rhizobium leucaenae TaxID=29450 RepID=UPI001AECB7E5
FAAPEKSASVPRKLGKKFCPIGQNFRLLAKVSHCGPAGIIAFLRCEANSWLMNPCGQGRSFKPFYLSEVS